MADLDDAVAQVQDLIQGVVAAFREGLETEFKRDGSSPTERATDVSTTSDSGSLSFSTDHSVEVRQLMRELEQQDAMLGKAHAEIEELKAQLKTTQEQLAKERQQRRELSDELMSIKGNIRVFVRIKPLLGAANVRALQPADERTIMIKHSRKQVELDGCLKEDISNAQVFNLHIIPVLDHVLDGKSGVLFAYGQTGSGKTHTMLGNIRDRGLLQRCLEFLLSKVENGVLVLSAIQIYNDQVMDLMDPAQPTLDIRLDSETGEYSPRGLTKIEVSNQVQAEAVVHEALSKRATASHAMNKVSSRSHLVVSIEIEGKGSLCLVDLAGSERLSRTITSGERLKESQHINKSLSALGDVLSALGSKDKKRHVPFRNSKLTFLLQNHLQGRSLVAFLACVDPDEESVDESSCTIAFAERIRRVELAGWLPSSSTHSAQNQQNLAKTPNQTRPRLVLKKST